MPFQNNPLHYVSLDTQAQDHPHQLPVMMVHGTPGNWETFRYVLGNPTLQSRFRLAAVDRLNWGESQLTTLNTPSDYQAQVDAIATMIQHFSPDHPVVLVGHSLGASIIPRVALDYPERVAGLLLIAGTLDPKLGGPRWYNLAANNWLVSQWLGDDMQKSNVEIMQLQDSLTKTLPVWQSLTIPVTVIQGTSDRLVSPQNARFAQQQLKHLGQQFRLIELAKIGHFIPWKQTHIISDELLRLAEKIN